MKIRKNGKVINLTESDLQRIVKRVISEQSNVAKSAAKKFYDALEGSVWSDSEEGASDAVMSLKTKEDFIEFNNEIKKLSGGDDFGTVFRDNMSSADVEYDTIGNHVYELIKADPRNSSQFMNWVRAISSDMGMRGTAKGSPGGERFRGGN